jgi:hypothetical protein
MSHDRAKLTERFVTRTAVEARAMRDLAAQTRERVEQSRELLRTTRALRDIAEVFAPSPNKDPEG